MAKLAKKKRSLFSCTSCGHSQVKWTGKCPTCNEWDSLVEEEQAPGLGKGVSTPSLVKNDAPLPISIVEVCEEQIDERFLTHLPEVDRVLGGGFVPGSLVLLGGEPGIGKSTLLSQLLQGVSKSTESPLLYASGEESTTQAGLRAKRVGVVSPQVHLLAETNIEKILAAAHHSKPALLAIDSIQTMHTDRLDSIPGSVGQVRECASMLMSFAKSNNVPTLLIGHVTKEGSLAGPKTLEHLVDTVLHFEGEGGSSFRLLRAIKNRFGSTQEIGVFEMRSTGLQEVKNPSELFLAERPIQAPGSVVVASAEGNRPILVEIQALVASSNAGFGRRTSNGFDNNRLSLLIAVLERHGGFDILGQDVFLNVAGGLKLSEPATDLGVLLALASSVKRSPIDPHTIVIGEVGLAGEIRAVNMVEARIGEAAKLGFKTCLLPTANCKQKISGIDIKTVPIKNVQALLEHAFK